MKVIIIRNGITRIVLQPSDDVEKAILHEMVAKGPVEISLPDRLQIVDENMTDSVIIANQKVEASKQS